MVNLQKLFISALGLVLLSAFSCVQAEDKHVHLKGPNGGDVVEVGDAAHHHIEFVHDQAAGAGGVGRTAPAADDTELWYSVDKGA